jgi:prepilin-type processing-associated H-X9-DG protein
MAMIQDGLTQTLAVTECAGNGYWNKGGHAVWPNGQNIGSVGRINPDPKAPAVNMDKAFAWENEEPRSDHPGGVHALMCDGSVQFWENSIDVRILRAAASRDWQDDDEAEECAQASP